MSALPDPERLVEALVAQMRGVVAEDAGFVGIHTGGVWIAERLHRESRRSQIPFPVDGREIVLVDDVLHTGRTIRAALNELFDFGRPRAVRLAMLADRGGRELPMSPDFLGAKVDVGADEELVLSNEGGRLRLAAVKRPA